MYRKEDAVQRKTDLAPVQTRTQPINGGGPSLTRIFDGTLSALSRRGAKQLSMTDVCEASGISRATLYRYFAKKEDLLAALGEHVTNKFIHGVKDAAALQPQPGEKLRAVLQFTIAFSVQIKSDRILEVEPEFLIKSLHRQFPRHLAAISEALEPVYDAFDKRLGCTLDRAFITELLLRAQESTSLIPPGDRWNALPDLLADFAMILLDEFGNRKAARR